MYYLKDNRLLPSGFEKTTASEDIKPRGSAYADQDFIAGEDTILYQVELGNSTGPFTVEAELLYQPISYRWAEDLKMYDTDQIQRFSEYYYATPNLPVQIAEEVVNTE